LPTCYGSTALQQQAMTKVTVAVMETERNFRPWVSGQDDGKHGAG